MWQESGDTEDAMVGETEPAFFSFQIAHHFLDSLEQTLCGLVIAGGFQGKPETMYLHLLTSFVRALCHMADILRTRAPLIVFLFFFFGTSISRLVVVRAVGWAD